MQNILQIVKDDTRRICKSVIGIVIIVGLCVVPCLYAWFNIFSNWDPYGVSATSRIRVSVVTQDRGAEILGIRLNIGDTMIEALEANDQIGWVFADSKEEALWRVYSGDCYAAIVVPPDFSRDFVSFVTLRFEHPQLQYYENGKKNAIAPKITGQAKTSVQKQINATFLQTLVSTASEVVVAMEANGMEPEKLLMELSDRLDDLNGKLADANKALDNLANVANSAQNLLLASSTLVSDMSSTVGYTGQLAGYLAEDSQAMDLAVRQVVNEINQMIQASSGNTAAFFGQLSEALSDPEAFNRFLTESRDQQVQNLSNLQARAAELQSAANGAGLSGMAALLGDLSGNLGQLSQDLQTMEPVDPGNQDQWAATRERLMGNMARIARLNETLVQVSAQVAEALGIRIETAFDRVNEAASSTEELLLLLQERTTGAANSLAATAGSMARLQTNILSAESGLNEARLKLRDLSEFVDALAESEFLQEILELLRSGPDVLDDHVASPLQVSEEILFNVDSYGSQMSPFYTVLAQWVGALFCAVLLKTRIREQDKPPRLTMPQHFFGRYGLYLFVGVAQALITSLGNLLYVNILCTHPVAFVLAAVMTGICFTMINYALAFSLGAAGLGASVIIMVLQVGGAGGTYPVEVLPKVFQVLYPYMPFKFAMNAMREAVSGFYGLYYLQNLGALLLITLISIGFAFLAYVPGKWLNDLLEKAKAKTGVMV